MARQCKRWTVPEVCRRERRRAIRRTMLRLAGRAALWVALGMAAILAEVALIGATV